jgi:hypothetical protein
MAKQVFQAEVEAGAEMVQEQNPEKSGGKPRKPGSIFQSKTPPRRAIFQQLVNLPNLP